MESYPMFIDWKQHFKMATSPKAIYRFNTVPVKISATYFVEINSSNVISYVISKDPRSQKILRRNNQVEGLMFPDFEIYYEATAIK